MFTGLIEEIGTVTNLKPLGQGVCLTISASMIMEGLKVDDSIAVNGCCLTAVRVDKNSFDVEAVEETLKKTTLGLWKIGEKVNLERAMLLSKRLGGHLVLGHVDGVGRIIGIEPRTASWWVTLEIPTELEKYIINVGSITIDGVSLTVAQSEENRISVSIIPHTWEKTIIANKKAGDAVNLEGDLIGKYVEKLMMTRRSDDEKITEEWLLDRGL